MGYANQSRPMGFVPLSHNGKYMFNVTIRNVPSVRQASAGGNASLDMAVGDAYALDANGNAYRAGPNDVVRGIVWGFRFLSIPNTMNGMSPLSIDYITGTGPTGSVPTATIAVILGIEDQTVDFAVQADTFATTQVGGKFNLADAAPDPLYAQSRQTINIGGGAGAQFQVSDIVQRPTDNTYGANAVVVARMLQPIFI